MSQAILSAFLVGLAGSGHCVGMCGGIVGALCLGLPQSVRARAMALAPYLLLYNAGRISSYALAGAIAGGVGATLTSVAGPENARLAGRVLSGGFMVALGLYVAGWWPALALLERWGGALWRRIEPLARRLLPVRSPSQALAAGLAWGWLPCGMVYSALALALTAGSAATGAGVMAAFGLGTLPMLLVMGAAASRLAALARQPLARRIAGVFILGLGLWTLFASHGHH
jgi:sulfite exporter TauE/SafE